VKLDAATGAILWNVAYNGAGNRNDFAYALAVDANGDVIVTGFSGDATDDNLRTIKYRGSDGVRLWTAAYPGVPGKAIGTDANRNVFVAASSFSIAGLGYTVIKYAADTGAQLWLSSSARTVIPTASPGPLSGLWWNPAESGWGSI
jgi:hypothetical protein